MDFTNERAEGAVPGCVFALKSEPKAIIAAFQGGAFVAPDQYTVVGREIRLKYTLEVGDPPIWVACAR